MLVRFYIAFLSPFLGGACKFYPSCSQYAREAVAVHGARRGFILAMKRLGRCRPFTKGGFDPVPDAVFAKADASVSEAEPERRAWSRQSLGAATARGGEKPAA
ncbi:MAG: membrane protein insertion efficiency factor YidD [Candidatus Acidiferrales bacterium]